MRASTIRLPRPLVLAGAAALAALALRGPAAADGDSCPDSRTRLEALRAAIEGALPSEIDPRAVRALQSARAAVLSPGRGLAPAADALAAAMKDVEKKAPGRGGVDGAALEALEGLLEDAEWELTSLETDLSNLDDAKEAKVRARIRKALDQAGALSAVSVAKAAKALVPGARLLRDVRIPPVPSYGGPLRVVHVNPLWGDLVGLNRPVEVQFSGKVVPSSVRPDTIFVRSSPLYSSQLFGDFEVADNIVLFHPRLPMLADLSDGGYPSGRTIRVTVTGFPSANTVTAPGGKGLSATHVQEFTTAFPGGLLYDFTRYRDPPPPRVRCTAPADVLPAAPWTSPGGATGAAASVAPLFRMNRVPLDPSSLASRVTLRAVDLRGVPVSEPIPGQVLLDQDNDEVRITFRPSVTLADRSRYAVRIEAGATDLTGQFEVGPHEGRAALAAQASQELIAGGGPLSDLAVANPYAFDARTFLVFTVRDEAPQDRTLALHFDGTDVPAGGGDGSDPSATTASYDDAVPGAVAASITSAGGDGSLGDLAPSSSVALDTGSAQSPGGVFHFRRIDIPPGVTVTLTGPLPAVLRSTSGITVRGAIVASGAAGETSETIWSTATYAQRRGGAGGPGGGAGGSSSTEAAYGLPGESGSTGAGGGGSGGSGGYEGSSTTTTTGFAGGGGGGGRQFAGSAGRGGTYPSPGGFADNAAGGAGGLPSGPAPTSTVTDEGRQFTGLGGGGGGAGGNGHYTLYGWRTAAAGGGGGGGALLLSTNRSITVSGQVIARGGAGGANATGQPDYGAGAGGGGSGGAVALFATGGVDVTGATLDTAGGPGGATAGFGWVGSGGGGGAGFIRLESGNGSVAGTSGASFLPNYTTGTFDPASAAGDLPSVFTGAWFDLGAMEPTLLPFQAQHFTEQEVAGSSIGYEIQMARASAQDPALPDTASLDPQTGATSDQDRASDWVLLKDTAGGIRDVAPILNGHRYRFVRIRISFTLAEGLRRSDGLPFVDEVRIPFRIHQ